MTIEPPADDDGTRLIQYTLFDHPADFPEHIVVRRVRVGASGIQQDPEAWLFEDLESARAALPPGLWRQPRQPDDHPIVVEVWF